MALVLDTPAATATEAWIVEYWNSQAYRDGTQRISETKVGSISPPPEVAMIVGLLEHL